MKFIFLKEKFFAQQKKNNLINEITTISGTNFLSKEICLSDTTGTLNYDDFQSIMDDILLW